VPQGSGIVALLYDKPAKKKIEYLSLPKNLSMENSPVSFEMGDFGYLLTLENSIYQLFVQRTKNMQNISARRMTPEKLAEEAEPLVSWVESVLGVRPEISTVPRSVLKKS